MIWAAWPRNAPFSWKIKENDKKSLNMEGKKVIGKSLRSKRPIVHLKGTDGARPDGMRGPLGRKKVGSRFSDFHKILELGDFRSTK